MKRRILVTGATGFIGRHVCRRLDADDWIIRAVVRNPATLPSHYERYIVPDIREHRSWDEALADVDSVVHLAGRAHVMSRRDTDDLDAHRRVNTAPTAAIAEACRRVGIRRFVFLSTVKVNGEWTDGQPFHEDDQPKPSDAYATSKWEAEQIVNAAFLNSGVEPVTIRPCLVYGPGVKGNIERLIRAVLRGVPLPFASIRNKRSLLAIENLCDLLLLALDHRSAPGRTYLAADGEDMSTPDIVRALAAGLARNPRLLPLWPALLKAGGAVIGARAGIDRLVQSLQVSTASARRDLGWNPTASPRRGLELTAKAYLDGAIK